ncbi:hypothetical protein KAR10_02475 [bacterium]|nr:hypothetical protein [bacterium]
MHDNTDISLTREIDQLAKRLEHLLYVESYATPAAVNFVLSDQDGIRRPAFLLSRTAKRLVALGRSALPRLEHAMDNRGMAVPEQLILEIRSSDQKAKSARSWATFDEDILPKSSALGDRIDQLLRRVYYLGSEEDYRGEFVRALLISLSFRELARQLRPTCFAYLLRALKMSTPGAGRDTLLDVARHLFSPLAKEGDLSMVMARMREAAVESSTLMRGVKPDFIDQLIREKVLPADFELKEED